ncbi:MAG: hypothetical protein KDJ43_10290 [Rhizobiaceae bacterium]|nr:hypothetical protein [Rhizobiaceae bacterium]MCC0042862.1 hypothetical protein [Brucellaceae bacterium]
MVTRTIAAALSLMLAGAHAGAAAEQACGLCAKSVVINSALASCFLEQYPLLERRSTATVAINLEDCEEERGVVAALRGPSAAGAQPSRKFFLSLSQLVCLKRKLEDPGMDLDPSAQIDLGDC